MIDPSLRANGNISHLLKKGDLLDMELKLTAAFGYILDILRIDQTDPNIIETPARLARMYIQEVFKGRYEPIPKLTTFPNEKNLDELFIVGPITIRSCCSHHFVPFIGKLWIGVIPGDTLLGLSKFARVAEWVLARPQIQEEAIQMLADILETHLQPKGLAIVMKAKHFCMCWRGVKDADCEMTTSVVRGWLKTNDSARSEFLNLIKVEK